MDIIPLLAPFFERYITFEKIHPSATYNYKARGFFDFPVIETIMHRKKCSNNSWLYITVNSKADLNCLKPSEKLYVGSQTQDRMFRGDGLSGRNFHHAEMRSGNGEDNLISFLRTGEKAVIHIMSAASIESAISKVPDLEKLKPLLSQSEKHIGYWFEQYILHFDSDNWRWNTMGAEKNAINVVSKL